MRGKFIYVKLHICHDKISKVDFTHCSADLSVAVIDFKSAVKIFHLQVSFLFTISLTLRGERGTDGTVGTEPQMGRAHV